ncbi:MAG: pyridoxamine 5'-phosphate oxidase family protein [Patescibacteria group bacterium]|nr:pyridoxamine 5'-phosphate oxidase family protein [Patescibacteria group bacterium]
MKERTKLEKLIREYLEKGTLMQVATVSNNQPWIASVWYSFDKNLNIYFISGNYRRHSEEIRNHSKVAGSIVQTKYMQELGQESRGLTFEGIAEELGVIDSLKAFENFFKRWPKATKYITKKSIREELTKVRFYKIKPSLIVLFDEVNYPENPRQELILK